MICYVLLVWRGWFAEGVFAASSPVANKRGTDEEIAFFLSAMLEQFAYVPLGNGGLSRVLAFGVGRQMALLQPRFFWRT